MKSVLRVYNKDNDIMAHLIMADFEHYHIIQLESQPRHALKRGVTGASAKDVSSEQ